MNPELKQLLRDRWDSEMIAAIAHHDQASAATDDMLSNMTEDQFRETLITIHSSALMYADSGDPAMEIVGLCIGRGLKQVVESLARKAIDE